MDNFFFDKIAFSLGLQTGTKGPSPRHAHVEGLLSRLVIRPGPLVLTIPTRTKAPYGPGQKGLVQPGWVRTRLAQLLD
jgi:hypothetical protein